MYFFSAKIEPHNIIMPAIEKLILNLVEVLDIKNELLILVMVTPNNSILF
ncbi:hypothetical protein Back11_07200 [Paenibacillus baekrokdamisoli]|uniref:Uncharacterized protein n=1 Tax=Paenibacillus baekrokdamisoli TaxID=1712516 RepID=A0A3G9ITJ7_9BACL|nr:hypothetical protein Back11_07200 [Paenibacillus baekrokdamisoli]